MSQEDLLISEQNLKVIEELTTNEKLNNLNNWSNLIVEGIEEALFSLDKDWRFTYLNNQAAKMWDRAKEALLGKVMWEEFPTLLGTSLENFYRQAMAQDRPDRMETFSSTTQAWYDVRVYPIPQGLIVFFEDITRRKQLEQALQESEERFKALSEATFEGVIVYQDEIVIEANQSLAKMYGYDSPAELISTPVFNYVAPESLSETQNRIAENFTDAYEVTILKKDGSRLPIEVRGKTLQYRGRTVRVTAVRDITERKLTEQQLRDSETRYKVLSEAAFEGVIIHHDGVILEANQNAAQMFGYSSPQELIGQTIDQYLSPQTLAEIQNRIAEDSEEIFEGIAIRRDNSHFPVEARDKSIEYQGQTVRVKVLTDITEHKLKEQQLRDSETRYKILSEATFEGVVIHHNGIILEANQSAINMFGYSNLEEVIGLPILSQIVPENREEVLKRASENYEGTFEITMIKKDGTHVRMETRGRNIAYRGQPMRVVAGRDITERKQAEEKLQKTQAQLLQAQKMESVGRLAGGVAHDFNNLLTAIIGYSELLSFSLSEDDPSYSDVMEIQKAANRAAALTRQLLAFSRQQVMEPKVLDLNEVVADMDKLLQRLIGEDIELRSLLEPELGEVLADPGQIEQVIVNLAVNARDAMSNGGKLTIETANVELDEQYHAAGQPQLKTGSYIMLAVSDTGQGMDAATQEKIFEPFFTTKEIGRGTGLGLSTVYGIVNQSEGYIWVYSEIGRGTTFKIYLPRVNSLAMIDENKTPAITHSESMLKVGGATLAQEIPGHGYTVLLVEDDSLVRELVQRVLGEAGYIILEAYNGQQALELVKGYAGKIDLLLTDMVMPQMGGQELIDQVKEKRSMLKIVCMSGYTDRTVAYHETLQQCDAFLQKPFSPTSLLSLIEQVLKSAS